MKRFKYAINGLISAFQSEVNMRIHTIAAVFACVAGLYFDLSTTEWIMIIFCIVLVISFELINTAIEELCDIVQPEKHPVIKKIKDVAAGAVLLAAIGSVTVAIIIFLPKIISAFNL